jgi:hypothetical protein
MKLENNETFKKDLDRYKQAIERMPTKETKNKLEYLIRTLILEIRYFDSQHDELNISKTLPGTIIDSRSKIFEIRSQIENLLK